MNNISINTTLIELFSITTCSIIIALMIVMAIRIMSNYRNKLIYIILIVTLACDLIRQFIVGFDVWNAESIPTHLYIISTSVQLISFIILNFVLMKMYAVGTNIKIVPIIVLLVGAIAVTIVNWIVEPYSIIYNNVKYFAFPIMDFYMFILIITMLVVTRHIQMTTPYYISLLVMFMYELAYLLHMYVFEMEQRWLFYLIISLPVLYYVFIFFLLFEWVLERLLSTYQSSIVDGLTGLYIRRYFQKTLTPMIARQQVAIIFCDIDNFKRLNDTQGHQVADNALQQVASILKEEVSPFGIAGRYGGEELLGGIVIERIKPMQIAERIRARIEQETIVTVSVGFSTTKEADNLSLLIKQSDEAMYYSKATGKNKVSAYKSIPAAVKNKL
ncbi:MAG TPA: GGDEF domain-containing protein [Candidatus Paenibacillus intestinavium]|nr:GGDEF domain-containing protein [Candidatus Paenibacillus intestinavium]